ncbi:MAG: hypothetical protein FJY98_02630 [Candidatus Liptonbacteria bacterium]|nr:hypothetical protein [Candidatus Liptonbacteria bacterium]
MIRDLSSPKPNDAGNLVAQVPLETEERSSGFYFSLVLDVLTVAFAFWTGLMYQSFLTGEASLGGVAAVATLFGTFLAVGLYLTRHAGRRILVIVGVIVGLFLFTLTPGNAAYVGLSAILTFLLLLWGEALARARIANSLEVRFTHGVQPLLSKATTALVFSGLILFIPIWTPAKAFLSPAEFNSYYEVIGGTLHRFYGEINFSGTFDQFASSLARYELLGNADFKRLPPSRQAAVTEEVTVKVKENLGKTLEVKVEEGKKSMGAIFYKLSMRTLGDLQGKFGTWFLVGWAILLFAIIRGVGVFLYWIAGLLGLLMFHILLLLGITRLRGETRTQQVAEYI